MAKDPKLDFYSILGVHPNAEDVVIRAAFKALAQRYHPDRFAGSQDEAHRKMSDLSSAYEVLADPVRRRKYDRRRRLYTRTASFYIKDPSRDKRPNFPVVNHVSGAARQRRYRVALSVLMATVVVLTAFNLYQYSGRLKDWLGSSPPAPATAADAPLRGKPDAPIPAVGAARSDPTDGSAAKVKSLPIGQATRAIGTSPAVALAPPVGQSSSAAPVETQLPPNAGKAPPRPAVADATRAVAAPAGVPQAVATALRKEIRPAGAKSAAARNAPASRPSTTATAVGANSPCSDVVLALGLCTSNTTVKGN